MVLKRIKQLFLTLLILSPLSASAHVESKTIRLKIRPGMTAMSLKVVQVRDSAWSESMILNELNKVNSIYAQCKVQIKDVQFYKSHFKSIVKNEDDLDQLEDDLVKSGIRKKNEVTLIFTKELGGDLKWFVGEVTAGFSIPSSNDEDPARRTNLALLFEVSQTAEYKKRRHPSYDPVAHELGHVLLNSPHVDYPNLMAAPDLSNGELTPAQCETMIQNPFVQ